MNNGDCGELSQFDEEVRDAKLLLDYVVSSGYRNQANETVADNIIMEIKKAVSFASKGDKMLPGEMTSFEKAYRDLAILTSPVTAESLKATSSEFGRKWIGSSRKSLSESAIWSRKLTLWTLLFVILAITGNSAGTFLDQFSVPYDYQVSEWRRFFYYLRIQLDILVPFTYGGIGACAYLLRACHQYMYNRQFDIRRIPEYNSRMLLGLVSGGAINLFIAQIGDDKAPIKLSAAALGFLAGYNNDLLFNTIERISQAILPKVGLESIKKAEPRPGQQVEPVSMKELLDAYKTAQTDEEKQFFRELMEKWNNRI